MLKTHRYLPAALLAVGLFTTAPACAAQLYGSRGDVYRNIERRAYDNGYREGTDEGRNDARRGRGFSPERHDEYRDADAGYRRGDGDRELYRRSYRQGFQAGYRQAFDQVAGHNGPAFPRWPSQAPNGSRYPNGNRYPDTYPDAGGVYGSPARQAGYRDGLEAGRRDSKNGDSYDPLRSRDYRSADSGYDRRYGSKDDYKQQYRAAFQQGYEEGFRGTYRR